jgi:ankyrin repeat protein
MSMHKGVITGNALQAACYGGHYSVVTLLLERGADINAQGGSCGNALQAASFGGMTLLWHYCWRRGLMSMQQRVTMMVHFRQHHSAIVQLLLEEGADSHPCS